MNFRMGQQPNATVSHTFSHIIAIALAWQFKTRELSGDPIGHDPRVSNHSVIVPYITGKMLLSKIYYTFWFALTLAIVIEYESVIYVKLISIDRLDANRLLKSKQRNEIGVMPTDTE